MSGLLTVRDAIRDFLRKFDEITAPIIKFIAAYIMFLSINSLFGYSDLFDKKIVVFLLSVISALVSEMVVVFIGGAVLLVNAFAVSLEIGLVMLVVIIVMYCLYMRLFPDCGWILAFVPIMFMLHLNYAIPLVIVIFAGAAGIVPAGFGTILYYISKYIKEIVAGKMLDDEEFQSYTYILDALVKNKELMVYIIVFSVVILIASIIYKLPFDYSWYVAIAVGGMLNILVFLLCGPATGVSVNMGSLVLSSLLAIILTICIQACKSIVDYSAKETVQFEDDDYYYYVKAIPKFTGKRKKNVKNITEEAANEAVAKHKAADKSQARNPQARDSQTKSQTTKSTQARTGNQAQRKTNSTAGAKGSTNDRNR